MQERPEQAEKEACLTLRELEHRFVRYIVDKYNQRADARLGDQTRYQRWEAGLIASPNVISEEELRICLMKQTRRSIYRGGYLQFENLTYRGENLAGYAGESVVLRYDPKDITTVLVYRQRGNKEEFLARAFAQDLETEQLSLDEAKASSRKIRQAGKMISNRSMLAEVRDRSEQEIAGYRDVLTTIHTSYAYIPFTPSVVLQLHRDLYQFTVVEGGRGLPG